MYPPGEEGYPPGVYPPGVYPPGDEGTLLQGALLECTLLEGILLEAMPPRAFFIYVLGLRTKQQAPLEAVSGGEMTRFQTDDGRNFAS